MKKKYLLTMLPILVLLSFFVKVDVNHAKAAVEDDFTYTTNDDGTYFIIDYNGPGGKVVIPAKINGSKVTGISNSAFYMSKNITSVTIPNGVTSIGNKAFYKCKSLKSITIPSSI